MQHRLDREVTTDMTRQERIELAQKRMSNDPAQGNGQQSKGAWTMPEGATMYKIKEGRNLIDILPYRITNPKNPACRVGFKVGDEDYMQVYHVHQNIGTNKNMYLCNSKMYGGRCPICDIQRGMWETDREGAKKLYPKDRVIYNVIDLLEPDKGVQLFEGSYFWLEKQLRELSALKGTDGIPVLYGDREDGMSIEFYGVKQTFEGREFFKPDHFGFVPRENKYDESVLDLTYPIDAIFNVPDYKTVENDYYGIEEEEDNSEVESIAPSAPSAPSAHATPRAEKKSEKSDFDKMVDEDEKTVIGMAETPDAPFDTTTTPPTRRRREKACVTCPFGHTCGADFDKTDDCTECDDATYDKCGDLFDKMNN